MKKVARIALIVYLLTWLGAFLFIIIIVAINGRTIWEGATLFVEMVPNASFLKGFHVFVLPVLGLVFLIRYLVRSFREKGFQVFLKRLALYVLVPTALLIFSYKTLVHLNSREDFVYSWDTSVENLSGVSNNCYELDGLHRGMSVFGWNRNNDEAISELVKNNVEWVAVIPFMDQKDEQSSTLATRESYETWSRRDSMHIEGIVKLREKGIRVHLKPHLWLSSGWRSNINLSSKTPHLLFTIKAW